MANKILFSLILIFIGLNGYGQSNHFPPTGNAGVGTGTSPAYPFHVKTSTSVNRARFEFGGKTVDIASYGATSEPYGNAGGIFMSGQDGFIMTGAGNNLRFITNSGGYVERMRILANGNIGIGTGTPTYRFEVAGNSKWTGNSSSYTEVNSNSNGQYLRQYANNGTTQSWLIRGYAGADGVQAFFDDGGINVNGTVKSREVNVTATGWPDYVFKPEYKLMPLSELDAYIQMNGHLPDVPTEAEVMENGVNLAEMNVKLLEKVEELTLYTIYQEDLILQLVKRIENLENK